MQGNRRYKAATTWLIQDRSQKRCSIEGTN